MSYFYLLPKVMQESGDYLAHDLPKQTFTIFGKAFSQ